MKTAITEMMEIVEMDFENGITISMKSFHSMLKRAKKKEKQQIIDCYNDAYQDPPIYSEDVGKKYYDETYNNDTLNREK